MEQNVYNKQSFIPNEKENQLSLNYSETNLEAIEDKAESENLDVSTNPIVSIQTVAYTISCESFFKYDLINMLNCCLSLSKLEHTDFSPSDQNLKLVCRICQKEFSKLDELLAHKQRFLNKTCCENSELYIHSESVSSGLESENFFEIESNETSQVPNMNSMEENLFDLKSVDLPTDLISHTNTKNSTRQKRTNNDKCEKSPSPYGHHQNPFSCEKCKKPCKTKAEQLVHMHKHQGNSPTCWICNKNCASFSNLVYHVQLHTGEKPFQCKYCNKQFTQDAHLTRHLRLHTGERPFECSICGKNYKDYSYYKTHLRIHRGERMYKCNICKKEFYDASYYKKHSRLHTGEKPYMCTICGKQFHRSDYLKLHSYSHTHERPYNCYICGKGFKMNYSLKLHIKNHLNVDERYNEEISTLCSTYNENEIDFDSQLLTSCNIMNETIDSNSLYISENSPIKHDELEKQINNKTIAL